MTAPALNLAQIAVPGGPAPAGTNVAAGAPRGQTATGFDALIAALTPAAGSTTATAAEASAEIERGEAEDATASDGALIDATAFATVAAFQLLPAAEAPPPAAGQDHTSAPPQAALPAAKGQPAFLPADGGLTAAAAQASDAPTLDSPATDGVTADDEPAQPPVAGVKGAPHQDKPAAPAFGRDKAPEAPAQPALDNANPRADLAAKAAAAEAPEPVTPPPAPSDAPPVATTEAASIAVPTPQGGRPEPAKAARLERKVSTQATDASDVTKPVDVTAKPLQAKAAGQAAGKPASDTVEAVDPKAGEAKAEADSPDATPPGETRAAPQSSALADHGPHAVRGTPETVANLAAQIVKKLEAKTTRFDLELDPHGLGRVDVRVEIGAHGKMTASMVFENPQAAHDLKARAAELQRTLEQAGFDLSGGLSFDVADQGRQQGQAWQDQAETGLGFRGRAFRAALDTAGEAADAASSGALRLRRGVNAGVDVRI